MLHVHFSSSPLFQFWGCVILIFFFFPCQPVFFFFLLLQVDHLATIVGRLCFHQGILGHGAWQRVGLYGGGGAELKCFFAQRGGRCVMNSAGVTRRVASLPRGTVPTGCQRDRPRCHCDAKIDRPWSFGCTSWTACHWCASPSLSLHVFPCANYRIWSVFVSFGLWLHLLSVCLTGDITRNYFGGFGNVFARSRTLLFFLGGRGL